MVVELSYSWRLDPCLCLCSSKDILVLQNCFRKMRTEVTIIYYSIACRARILHYFLPSWSCYVFQMAIYFTPCSGPVSAMSTIVCMKSPLVVVVAYYFCFIPRFLTWKVGVYFSVWHMYDRGECEILYPINTIRNLSHFFHKCREPIILGSLHNFMHLDQISKCS